MTGVEYGPTLDCMGRFSDGHTTKITTIPGKRISKKESLRRRALRQKHDRAAEARAVNETAHMRLDEDRPL